ncbi:MAG: cytochrome c oxidase assembly protein [Acidimicrobiales bacterium]
MTGSPWAFDPHVVLWCVLAAIGAAYGTTTRGRPGPDGAPHPFEASRRQRLQFCAAAVSLAVALSWPVADLAAHWSLTALIVQRLLLVLVCAPLLLLATPVPILARLTRPALVDGAVDFVTRPAAAIVIFMIVVIGTLSGPAMHAQSTWPGARAGFDVLLLFAGFVLWTPVFDRVPGARRASPVGRAVYLIVQSVLPNFPSFIFVFAHHPLYSAYLHSHLAIGISPVNDQQVAGIVAKVGTLPVMWSAAWRSLSRAARAEQLGVDAQPLQWADVARELERTERAERAEHLGRRRHGRARMGPAQPSGDAP